MSLSVSVCDFFEDLPSASSSLATAKPSLRGANGYKEVVAIPRFELLSLRHRELPPHHVEAAIRRKHVFAEKPVAVDGPGVRQFLAAAAEAKAKGLALVAGTQRRHQRGYLLQAKALQEGKLGKIVSGNVYWNGTVPWVRNRGDLKNDAYL